MLAGVSSSFTAHVPHVWKLNDSIFKHYFVYLFNILHVQIVLVSRSLLLRFLLIWLAFDFDFVLVLVFVTFSLELLFVVVLVELEEVLDGLTFRHWRRQVGKAIAQEDAIASVVENVVSDHLRQRLLLDLLLVQLLYLHEVFLLHVSRPEPRLLVLLCILGVERDEIIHDAFQLAEGPVDLRNSLSFVQTLILIVLVHFAHELLQNILVFLELVGHRIALCLARQGLCALNRRGCKLYASYLS